MKGLTPEEYEIAEREALGPGWILGSDRERQVLLDLVEQGRMVIRPPTQPGCWRSFQLTPSGREALRLWPLLRERFSKEQT